jgi:hypothetical protein
MMKRTRHAAGETTAGTDTIHSIQNKRREGLT